MCFTVQLSKIIFRIAVCLKQLCYYIMLFSACQEVFSTFLKLFLFLSCSNSDILSQCLLFVNNFFHLFLKFFFEVLQADERRKRDLNPRAGFPTYTLSRGASSASWVFLLAWISVISYSIYSVVHQQCICDYTRLLSQCQCLNSNFFSFLFSLISLICCYVRP